MKESTSDSSSASPSSDFSANPEIRPKDRSLTDKHSFSKEDLIECGHGRLFGPGRAQLPINEMLMVDRITEINETGGIKGKGQIRAELDVLPDLIVFNRRSLKSLERKPRDTHPPKRIVANVHRQTAYRQPCMASSQ